MFEALSFTLHAGQIMQIEGPNGAGKTSLLRIIAGFARADEGQIRYQGVDVRQDYDTFASELLFIGHKTGVNQQLSAYENVQYWLSVHGGKANEDSV